MSNYTTKKMVISKFEPSFLEYSKIKIMDKKFLIILLLTLTNLHACIYILWYLSLNDNKSLKTAQNHTLTLKINPKNFQNIGMSHNPYALLFHLQEDNLSYCEALYPSIILKPKSFFIRQFNISKRKNKSLHKAYICWHKC